MEPRELLRQGLERLSLPADDETIGKFMLYLSELRRWNRAYSITSIRDDRDVVVSHFLERTLTESLCAALRPGGLLFYQTFVRDKVGQQGPGNPDYLLAENELLSMFATLRLRVYREEGCLGDTMQGLRNEALYVGQKR